MRADGLTSPGKTKLYDQKHICEGGKSHGKEKDNLVVIGDGVDAVKLTNSLRKKVGRTYILSLAEVKAN